MAESLRRLINIGSFSILQDKLEKWLDDYNINSCDQNVARCCEVVELNAKVQSQLFKLLCLTASEGGMYGGSNVIKSRLLPWLGQNFFTSGGSVTGGTSLNVLAEAVAGQRQLTDLRDTYERSILNLGDDMSKTREENDDLRNELEFPECSLNMIRLKPTDIESHDLRIRKLREELAYLTGRRKALLNPCQHNCQVSSISGHTGLNETQDELLRLRIGTPVTHYEREIKNLKDEMRLTRPLVKSTYMPRSVTPLAPNDPVQVVRQNNAISRYNDMFVQDRLDVMDTLRRYSMDTENNQRIIFAVMQEAGAVARLAFRQFKTKVRSNIASCHLGPETLEEAVQDYINRNSDLYDLPGMVTDVMRGLNSDLSIFLPPRASYALIQPFIREACKLSWQMSALAYPLDLAIANDGELFEDSKYRRSYDSEYLAPLVNHHVWPTLMLGGKILMKGEAVTKRGASLGTSYRSRSRSPTRYIPPRPRSPSPFARSRSYSPRRAGRSCSPFRSISPYVR